MSLLQSSKQIKVWYGVSVYSAKDDISNYTRDCYVDATPLHARARCDTCSGQRDSTSPRPARRDVSGCVGRAGLGTFLSPEIGKHVSQ